MNKKLFLQKANKIHNNFYKYNIKSNIILQKEKIEIICPKHGIFYQNMNNHLNGFGCKNCRKEKLSKKYLQTKENFILNANLKHNNLYDYSLVEYKGNKIKIKIICKMHGIFEQTPNNHLKGNKCMKCSLQQRSNMQRKNSIKILNDFKKTHGNNYTYFDSEIEKYKNCYTKIKILCNKCNSFFKQSCNDHYSGRGCKNCNSSSISNKEIAWLNFYSIKKENRQKIIIINNKTYKVDGFDPNTNTIYEFFGDFWHGNPNKFLKNDINPINKKTFGELYENTIQRIKIFESAGYNLVYIWEENFKE